MLLTHMIDKIRPVRDSPPRQYATHPPLVRTRGGGSRVLTGGVRRVLIEFFPVIYIKYLIKNSIYIK